MRLVLDPATLEQPSISYIRIRSYRLFFLLVAFNSSAKMKPFNIFIGRIKMTIISSKNEDETYEFLLFTYSLSIIMQESNLPTLLLIK